MANGDDPPQRPDESFIQSGVASLPVSGVTPPSRGPSPDAGAHPFALAEADRYQGAMVIAQGGMGRVSAVTDARLRREVAMKEVLADDPGQGDLEARLAQEAWITAHLEHPAIVPVHDAGRTAQGRLYFTMRLIRGRPLSSALAAGDVGESTLLRHFLSACQAMGYAHAMAVIHRDLKPANIMLGEFGETQIVDWGLARPLGADGTASAHSTDSVVPEGLAAKTMVGAVVGTPAYMSPEQATAVPVGPATDVWSLGAILFEIIAGRPLYLGLTTTEVLERKRRGPIPRLRDVVPNASVELAAITDRALARSAKDRYVDAKALAEDVAAYLDGRRVDAYRYSAWDMAKRFARAFRVPLVVGAIGLVAIVAVALVSFDQTRDERDRAIAAEQRTSAALAAADRSFATALVQQAQQAQRGHARAEAELLASHALIRGPSPEARGVLARYPAARRPQLVAIDVAPTCRDARLGPAGEQLVCLEPDGTSLWRLDPLELAWRTPHVYTHAAFVSAAHLIAAGALDASPVIVDISAGAELGFAPDMWVPRVVAAEETVLGDVGDTMTVWRPGARERRRVRMSEAGEPPLDMASLLPVRGALPWAISADARVGLVHDFDSAAMVRIDLDTASARQLGPSPFEGGAPISAALDASGARLAVGSVRGELALVDTASGATRWRRTVTARSLLTLAWSPDDAFIATIDERGWPTVVDALGRASVSLPRQRARRLAWRRRGAAVDLVVFGDDLRVYRLPDRLVPVSFESAAGLSTLALNQAGDRLALPDGMGVVRVVDVHTGDRLQRLTVEVPGVAKSAVVLSDGRVAVAHAGEGGITVWSPEGRRVAHHLPGVGFRRLVRAADDVIVASNYGPSVMLVAPSGGVENIAPSGSRFQVTDIAASAEGGVISWLTATGEVFVVRLQAGAVAERRQLALAPRAVRVALDGRGQRLAVARRDGLVILDLASDDVVADLVVPGGGLNVVALAHDGDRVAAGLVDGRVIAWDVDKQTVVMEGAGHAERVSGLAFGSGELLFSAGWDGLAARWELGGLRSAPEDIVRVVESAWGIGLDDALRADPR